jgi:SnoaL-like polyketide cyclase
MDQKRANARAFLGYFENPAIDRMDEILTADCAIHVSGPIGQALPLGPEGARALNTAVSAFAVSRWRFEDEFGEGDRLVLRTINETIQHGVWNGLAGNGRTVSFQVVWIFRFERDAIAEVWRTADDLSRVRQLGGKIVTA